MDTRETLKGDSHWVQKAETVRGRPYGYRAVVTYMKNKYLCQILMFNLTIPESAEQSTAVSEEDDILAGQVLHFRRYVLDWYEW